MFLGQCVLWNVLVENFFFWKCVREKWKRPYLEIPVQVNDPQQV